MICATKGMLYYLVALASFDELENFWACNSKTVKISFFCSVAESEVRLRTTHFDSHFNSFFGFILDSF